MALYKLLLVDDNLKTQDQIRSIFSREPIEVTVVNDAPQALGQVEADRPNLILASANRSVDGYGIAHFVSRNPQLQSVSVLLLLTPKAVNDARIAESGASGFLLKPLRAGVVVARVREALGIPADNGSSAPTGIDTGAEGDLTAFDAIDANLEDGRPAERPAVATEDHEVTTEALAQIVAEAVTQAIGAYERARHVPAHGHHSTGASAHPHHDAQLDRLQDEMGLNDLSFAEAPLPEPVPSADPGINPSLAEEMGVTDFVIEDPAAPPTEVTESRPPDTPDEGVSWLANQFAVLREPQANEEPLVVEHHLPGAEPIRHAVEAMRAGVAHLSELVHHHVPIVPASGQVREPAVGSEAAPTRPSTEDPSQEPRKA